MFTPNHTHFIALACLFAQASILQATQVSTRQAQSSTQAPATQTISSEEIAKELEALKKASANGSCAASIKLCTYYTDKSSPSDPEATTYRNLARQQFLDNASEASLNALEEEAKKDSDAAEKLARCYENTQAKKRDLKKALLLYTQAASQDNAEAQLRLANCYLAANEMTGYDSVNAYTYYEACLKKGSSKKCDRYLDFAYLLERGIGGKRNQEHAKKLLDQAIQEFGKETVEQYWKKLTDAKIGFRDGIVVDCTDRKCHLDGETRIFQSGRNDPFTFACPCTLTSGQEILICDSCHQIFHLDCFVSWCRGWGIPTNQGCLNPKCSNKKSQPYKGTVL